MCPQLAVEAPVQTVRAVRVRLLRDLWAQVLQPLHLHS